MTFRVPEKDRVTNGALGSTSKVGENGLFHFKVRGVKIFAIASDGLGWEHVSVTRKDKKMPNWGIMCAVKDMFWDADDTVVQYHPPESDYVNHHPTCLHLWRPKDVELPCPPSFMVGPKGE